MKSRTDAKNLFKSACASLAIVAVTLLTACGMGGGTEAGGGGGGGEVGGEITFQTLQLKPTFNDYINGVIEDFEDENPGVTVEWVDVPFEGAAQKVVADSSAGQLPDVINLNPDYALPLAQNDVFVNMDAAAGDVKDDYLPGAWEAFEYPNLGHGVALPWYLSIELTLYNADYFREAGLDPDKPPTTIVEQFEYAQQVADQTDHYGMHPALENRLIPEMVRLGVPIVNEEGTEATFNTPEAVAYVEELVSLYQDGVMPPDSAIQTHLDEIDAYQSGQIALFPGGPNFLVQIRENAPDIAEATRIGPQPTGKADVTGMSAMGVMVPKTSENRATALEFAEFLTNAENQLEFAKVVTILPSTKESLQDPYFTDVRGDDPEAVARRISAEQIREAETLRPSVVSEEFNQVLVDKVEAALLGDLSAQEALDQAAEEATATLQQ